MDNPESYVEFPVSCSCGAELLFYYRVGTGGSEASFTPCPQCPARIPVPGTVFHALLRKAGRWEPVR
jgi:hypothetical protein